MLYLGRQVDGVNSSSTALTKLKDIRSIVLKRKQMSPAVVFVGTWKSELVHAPEAKPKNKGLGNSDRPGLLGAKWSLFAPESRNDQHKKPMLVALRNPRLIGSVCRIFGSGSWKGKKSQ
jgi:hypothetical protein